MRNYIYLRASGPVKVCYLFAELMLICGKQNHKMLCQLWYMWIHRGTILYLIRANTYCKTINVCMPLAVQIS